MASNSQNGNGYSDSPPVERPLEEILLEYEAELDEILDDLATTEAQLQQHEETINRLAEEYREPRNVGETERELKKSEDSILPDYNEILGIQEVHRFISDRLGDTQVSMLRFWSILDRRETEQCSKRRKHRQEIENIQLEIQNCRKIEDKTVSEQQDIEAGHQAMIESLERSVGQCQANIQSLLQIRSKYKDVMKKVEEVKEAQEPVFARARTVSPLVERNIVAISNQRTRNMQELRATMNEQAGPSGLQVANVEGEASGQDDKKPETPETDESQEETGNR